MHVYSYLNTCSHRTRPQRLPLTGSHTSPTRRGGLPEREERSLVSRVSTADAPSRAWTFPRPGGQPWQGPVRTGPMRPLLHPQWLTGARVSRQRSSRHESQVVSQASLRPADGSAGASRATTERRAGPHSDPVRRGDAAGQHCPPGGQGQEEQGAVTMALDPMGALLGSALDTGPAALAATSGALLWPLLPPAKQPPTSLQTGPRTATRPCP